MATFSTGSFHKALPINSGLLSLDGLFWDTIQFQREVKYPHWTDIIRNTESNFPSAFIGPLLPLWEGSQYCPHCMDGETEGQTCE